MAFPHAKNILKIGSPSGMWKLLLATASFTRPKYRDLCLALLRPYIHNGEMTVKYRCYDRYVTMYIRTSELLSDLQCALELAVRDAYDLDPAFCPDLVVDGGDNQVSGKVCDRRADGAEYSPDSTASRQEQDEC